MQLLPQLSARTRQASPPSRSPKENPAVDARCRPCLLLARRKLEANIKVALGGRAAEEVVYNKITTGAESDIQQLTRVARQMVGRWGMSDKLGPLALLPSEGIGGYLLPGAAETSQQTQWLIDEEVRRIVDEAHTEVTRLLTDHRDQLESLGRALLAAETLDAADAYAAAQPASAGRRARTGDGDGRGGVIGARIVLGCSNVSSRRRRAATRTDGPDHVSMIPVHCVTERTCPARPPEGTTTPTLMKSLVPMTEHMNAGEVPTDAATRPYPPVTVRAHALTSQRPEPLPARGR